MSYAGLSLGNTPPLAVPLRYFLTAPWFLVLAGLLLLSVSPQALQVRWQPAWLAATHLWVLGFMSMVMLGAVQQVVPILLGGSLPAAKEVSLAGHLLLVPGALLLAWGLRFDCHGCIGWGTAALLAAVSILLTALFVALYRSPSRHPSARSLWLALAALLFTVLLGGWLALGHAGWWPLPRRFTDLHLAWGLLGWTVLLLTGVAWQVVPMFQVTPRYPASMMRLFPLSMTLSLLGWMGGRWWLSLEWLALAGELLASAALTAFAVTTLWLQARRRRKVPDATLEFWRLAMAALLMAVCSWWLRKAGVTVPEMLPAVLFAVGFVGAAIVGMLYKIVPFLVWLHLTNRAQARGVVPKGLPNMKQVIPAARSRLAFRLYLAWLAVLLAMLYQPTWWSRPAGGLLVVVGLVLAWHLLAAAGCYRRHVRKLAATSSVAD